MRKRINLWIAMTLSIILLSVTGLVLSTGNLFDPDKTPVHAAFSGGGAGTDVSPFIILTNADLDVAFRTEVNANPDAERHFKLGADITLSPTQGWESISRFGPNMVFDGDGREIRNLNGTTAFNIGFINNLQGTIKDVDFVDPQFTGLALAASRGVVAATVDSTATVPTVNARIENVNVIRRTANLGNVQGSRVGGLVGAVGRVGGQTVVTAASVDIAKEAVADGSVNLSIINSSNAAGISGTNTGTMDTTLRGNGGLVGVINRAHVNIFNSENTGNVRLETNANNNGVGGLVGLVTGTGVNTAVSPATTAAAVLNISASSNSGTVAFSGSTNSFVLATASVGSTGAVVQHGVGGLVGFVHNPSTTQAHRTQVNIRASSNESPVFMVANNGAQGNQSNDMRGVGGLVGVSNQGRINIEYSYNKGQIGGRLGGSGQQGNQMRISIGGLVGRVMASETTVSNSFNSGNLSMSGNVTSNQSFGGGLVGESDANTTVTGSANTGTVGGTNSSNGLINGTGTTPGSVTGPAAGNLINDLEKTIAEEIEAIVLGEFWVDIPTSTKYTITSENRFDEVKGLRAVGGGSVEFIILLDEGYASGTNIPVVGIFLAGTDTPYPSGDIVTPSAPFNGPAAFKYIINNVTQNLRVDIEDEFAPVDRIVNLPKGEGYTLSDFFSISDKAVRASHAFSGTEPTFEDFFRSTTFPHGWDLEFKLTMAGSHNVGTPTVMVDGVTALVEPIAASDPVAYTVTLRVMRDNPTVEIFPLRNSYQVTPPEDGDFDFVKKQPVSDMVPHGDYYVFDASPHPHHTMVVRWRPFGDLGAGTIITPEGSGPYVGSYAIQVTQRIEILVTTAVQSYNVTVPTHAIGTHKYEITPGSGSVTSIAYWDWFDFTIELARSHNQTKPEVRQGSSTGTIIDLVHESGDIYSGRFRVTGLTTLWVQDDYAADCVNEYTIVAPIDDGVWFTYAPDDGNIAIHDDEFVFTIVKKDGYSKGTVVVKINGDPLAAESDGITYIVDPVAGQFTITVEMTGGVKLDEFDVKYLPGVEVANIERIEGEENDDIKVYGIDLELRGVVFTSTTHDHVGWTTIDGGVVFTDESDIEFAFGDLYDVDDDLDLWPVWKEKTYSITFARSGPTTLFGSVIGDDLTVTKFHETARTLEQANEGKRFTTAGYEQIGWATTQNWTTTQILTGPGNPTTAAPIAFTAAITNNPDQVFYPAWMLLRRSVNIDWVSLDSDEEDDEETPKLANAYFGSVEFTDRAGFDATLHHGESVSIRVIPVLLTSDSRAGASFKIRISHDGGDTWVEEIPFYSEETDRYVIPMITANTVVSVVFRQSERQHDIEFVCVEDGYTIGAPRLVVQDRGSYSFTISFEGGRFSDFNLVAAMSKIEDIFDITGDRGAIVVTPHPAPSTFTVTIANVASDLTIDVDTSFLDENSYTITYNPGASGSGSVITDTKLFTETMTFRGTAVAPTFSHRDGSHTQIGWTNVLGGTTVTHDFGDPVGNADITLYPVWRIHRSTLVIVILNTDGSDFLRLNAIPAHNAGATYTLDPQTLTGHTLGAWGQTGSNGSWNAGTRTFTFGPADSATTTMTATWVRNQSQLTIVHHDATTSNVTRAYEAIYPIPVPVRSGWTFAGYTYSTLNGGDLNIVGTPITSVTFEFGPTTATTTLTEAWTRNRSTLEIDPAGGTYLGQTEITRDSGTVLSGFLAANPTRTGYDFKGWEIDGPLHGGFWNGTTTFTFGPNDGVTVVLKAQWDERQFDITFTSLSPQPPLNFGTVSGSRPPAKKDFFTGFTLPGVVFTTPGWTQTGWTTSGAWPQTTATHALNGTYTVNADETFYPFWTRNVYAVTRVQGTGYTLSGADTGLHGAPYTITVTLSGLYVNVIPVVLVDGVWEKGFVPGAGASSHIWTYTLPSLTKATTIKVELLYSLPVVTNGTIVGTKIEEAATGEGYDITFVVTPTNPTHRISGFTANGDTVPGVELPSEHPITYVLRNVEELQVIGVSFSQPTVRLWFNPNGGISTDGGKASAPVIPGLLGTTFINDTAYWSYLANTGYTLVGWSDGTTTYNINTVIMFGWEDGDFKEDREFTAIWTLTNFTVTLGFAVEQDGTTEVDPQVRATLVGGTGEHEFSFKLGQDTSIEIGGTEPGWQIGDGTTFITLSDKDGAVFASEIDLKKYITLEVLEALFAAVGSRAPEFTLRPILMTANEIDATITGHGRVTATTDVTVELGGQTKVPNNIAVTITITPNRHNRISVATINGVAISSIVAPFPNSTSIAPMVVTSNSFNATTGGAIVIAQLLEDIELVVTFAAIVYDVEINSINALNNAASVPSALIYDTEQISVVPTLDSNSRIVRYEPKSADGYSFNNYRLMTSGGTPYAELDVGQQSLFGQHTDGFMWLTLTEDFPTEFLHSGGTKIVINASYMPENKATLRLVNFDTGVPLDYTPGEPPAGLPAGVEVFFAYNDGTGHIAYFNDPWSGVDFGLGSEIMIVVSSNGHYSIKLDYNSDHVTFASKDFTSGEFVFTLMRDVVIDIRFKLRSVDLVVERLHRDGANLEQEHEVVGSGWEISAGWEEDMDIEPGDYSADKYEHVAWRIRRPNGAMVDIATGKFSNGTTDIADFFKFQTVAAGTDDERVIIKEMRFHNDFVEEFKNRDNEIVIVAIFSDKIELDISVSDNSEKVWHNRYLLKVNGVSVNGTTYENATNPFPIVSQLMVPMDLNYDTRIEIVPLPSQFYTFNPSTGVVGAGGLTFDLRMDRSITLNFESKKFKMNTGSLPSHTLHIDNVEQKDEEVTFEVGKTISIAFDAPDMQVFKTMRIGDVDISEIDIPGMVYKNGKLTITVTVDWLLAAEGKGWLGSLNSSTPGFTPTIEIDTEMNPLIIGGFAGIGVVALVFIIWIVFMIISIRRKRADYKVALEKHKAGMSRLKQNIVSDLVKD